MKKLLISFALISSSAFASDNVCFNSDNNTEFILNKEKISYEVTADKNVLLHFSNTNLELFTQAIYNVNGTLYKPELTDNQLCFIRVISEESSLPVVAVLPGENIGPVVWENQKYQWDDFYQKYIRYNSWIRHQVIFPL